jgi:glycosyltransferase involved in cell wall biosynthesis
MPTDVKKTKVTYIISRLDKAIAFEWINENLDKTKFDISFILLNDKPSYLGHYLKENSVSVLEILFQNTKDFPRVLRQVVKKLYQLKPHVIHTHMVEADIIGLTAGKILGIKKRIYTRHDANNRQKYSKKSAWIDRFSNRFSTHIAAISQNVKSILVEQEGVNPNKISLVYHGFDLVRFDKVPEIEKNVLIEKYNSLNKRPVIGVVSRYLHWKGIQYTIPAFKKILETYPNAFLILANAKKGDYVQEITEQLKSLPKESYCEIEFEHNLFALYHLFDVFVHVPIDEEIEAFGQIYVEALAAGTPSVFTNSGIAREFIQHDKNALLVDFQNTEQIYSAIKSLLTDKDLGKRLSENGKKSVKEKFSLQNMISTLENLYS